MNSSRTLKRRGVYMMLQALFLAALLVGGASGTAHASDSVQSRLTDYLLFEASMPVFLFSQAGRIDDDILNWGNDGCSVPWWIAGSSAWGDTPGGFNFRDSCLRHDFGYRNYKELGRFTEDNRRIIDDNFKDDMIAECNKSRGVWAWRGVECRKYADAYYHAVRQFG